MERGREAGGEARGLRTPQGGLSSSLLHTKGRPNQEPRVGKQPQAKGSQEQGQVWAHRALLLKSGDTRDAVCCS